MLKSCRYCGRMHKIEAECPQKPKPTYTGKDGNEEAVRFRSTAKWKRKREEIKERDKHLCQCCRRGLPGTLKRLNSKGLSVHHIVGLNEDFSQRLDNGNLLTLCSYHHDQADKGLIDRATLQAIARQQEEA